MFASASRSVNAREHFERLGQVGLPLVSDTVSPCRNPQTDIGSDHTEVKYCANLVKESPASEPTAIPSVLLQKVCLLHGGANVTGLTYCIKPEGFDLNDLRAKSLKDLKKRACEMGVREETIEVADETVDPKEYVLSQILTLMMQKEDIDYEDDSWLSYFAHDTPLGRWFRERFQDHGYKQRGLEDVSTHRYARVYTHNRHLATMVSLLLNLASEILEIQAAYAFVKLLPGWSSLVKLKYGWDPASVFATSYAFCWVVRLLFAIDWARARSRRDMHPAAGGHGRLRGDLITHSFEPYFEPLPERGARKCRMCDQKYDLFEQVLCCSCFSQCGKTHREAAAHGLIESAGYAHLSCTSMWRLRLQYLLLELLAVPNDAIYLHLNLSPFSHIQQWCAFQKDGARATMITYPFRGFWLYENMASNFGSYFAKSLSSLLQTVVRVWTFLSLLQTVWPGSLIHKFTILYSFVPALWRFIATSLKIRKLWNAKKLVKEYLKPQLGWSSAARVMWVVYGFGPLPRNLPLLEPLRTGTHEFDFPSLANPGCCLVQRARSALRFCGGCDLIQCARSALRFFRPPPLAQDP